MSVAPGSLQQRAAELRRAFDDAFARPAGIETPPLEGFLAIRLRGHAHALRLREVGRLMRLPALVRYPATAAGWLGLAGIAGAAVPVYDLGALAGYPADGTPSWLALCAAAPVALAFDAYDGQFGHAGDAEVPLVAGEARPALALSGILGSIQSAAHRGAARKEA
jgi:hypothetical protein